MKDHYKTLGVERNATQEDIRHAYRKLARKFHPDVSKETDAEARFKEIGEAYEVLKDAEKRAAYDRFGEASERAQQAAGRHGARQGATAGPAFEEDFFGADRGDFFEAMFGGRSGGARGPQSGGSRRGQDVQAQVLIDVEDAFTGTQSSISLRFPVIDAEGNMTSGERTLSVSIPKGIRDGQHLRLVGQGEPGSGGGAAGDLYLEIGLKPNPRYRVDGADVYMELPIAPWEAALGTTVTVPAPGGTVQLNIPAGSKGGRKLRLKGKGIPSREPGDLYVVLTIALPPADTEAAVESYRAMAKSFNFNPRKHLEGVSS